MTNEKKGKLAIVGEGAGESAGEGEAKVYDYAEERRIILALRDKTDNDIWDLAVALADAYQADKYRAWGYDSFREYVEKELDWHIRKAQIMVQLQEWFKGIPPNIQTWIKSLGWGKAKILMRVVTTENAAEWRNRIEGKTLAEIEEMLKEGRQQGEGGSGGSGEVSASVTKKMTFALYPDQHRNVEMALDKAKEMAESDKTGHCLDLICTEFLSTHAGVKNVKDYLSSVEKAIGFRLIAYDKASDSVIYGDETLDELDKMAAAAAGEESDDAVEEDAVDEG